MAKFASDIQKLRATFPAERSKSCTPGTIYQGLPSQNPKRASLPEPSLLQNKRDFLHQAQFSGGVPACLCRKKRGLFRTPSFLQENPLFSAGNPFPGQNPSFLFRKAGVASKNLNLAYANKGFMCRSRLSKGFMSRTHFPVAKVVFPEKGLAVVVILLLVILVVSILAIILVL